MCFKNIQICCQELYNSTSISWFDKDISQLLNYFRKCKFKKKKVKHFRFIYLFIYIGWNGLVHQPNKTCLLSMLYRLFCINLFNEQVVLYPYWYALTELSNKLCSDKTHLIKYIYLNMIWTWLDNTNYHPYK